MGTRFLDGDRDASPSTMRRVSMTTSIEEIAQPAHGFPQPSLHHAHPAILAATMPIDMAIARWARAGRNLAVSPALIFLFAWAARIRVLWQLLPAHAWINFYPWNEPSRIAWAVVSGFGYSSPWAGTKLAPTAALPPVYPLLLAGIFKIAGPYSLFSLWIAASLNALFSAFTAVLILRLGKRDFGEATGILAAWIWSLWLYEAVVSVRLWESSLGAMILAATLLWLALLRDSQRLLEWISFGVLAALAFSTNTSLLAVFPAFWLWLWVAHKGRGQHFLRNWLLSTAVAILCLVPWTVRNYRVLHRVIPLRDNFGLELWIGNHRGDAAAPQFLPDLALFDPTLYNQLGEIAFMERKRQMAWQFIRQHPGDFLRRSGARCLRYWSAPDGTPWPLVSLLAWAGLFVLCWRKKTAAVPYAVVMVFFPLVYYATHSVATYRHPIEPVVMLLAVYALWSGVELCVRRVRRG
jgi:4-amino-4-deoxy-L-arabinose transferase-like glycosyltransferase